MSTVYLTAVLHVETPTGRNFDAPSSKLGYTGRTWIHRTRETRERYTIRFKNKKKQCGGTYPCCRKNTRVHRRRSSRLMRSRNTDGEPTPVTHSGALTRHQGISESSGVLRVARGVLAGRSCFADNTGWKKGGEHRRSGAIRPAARSACF